MCSDHLGVSSKFKTPWAEWLMAHICQYVWMPESIARVEALKAHHGPGGPFHVQPVEIGMKLFQGQNQGFSWSAGSHLWLPSINFGACGVCYTDQLSVLVIILLISKAVQSSARVDFCSDLTILWSWPHMAWWLSPILFIWVSVQSLPLLSLQDALTLFLYF